MSWRDIYSVGDMVYPYGAPMRIGRVLKVVVPPDSAFPYFDAVYTVQTFGTKAGVWTWQGRSISGRVTELIAEHEKKLAGHKKRLAAAEAVPAVVLSEV